MSHHYIKPENRITESGNCVYEMHFQHLEGGWSIRFVEALDSEVGKEAAILEALGDLYKYYDPEDLLNIPEPIMTACQRHKSWEILYEQRKLGAPKNLSTIRGPKINQRLQNALDFLEDLPDYVD
jgi:hypothetical protein